MYLADLLVRLCDIVTNGFTGKVDRDWMLTSGDVDDWWRGREEGTVGCEIVDS